MTIRSRILVLLGLFAAYAVTASTLAVVAGRMRVEKTAREFEAVVAQAARLERLELYFTQHELLLDAVVQGRRDALPQLMTTQEKWQRTIAGGDGRASAETSIEWQSMSRRANALETATSECLAEIAAGEIEAAAAVREQQVLPLVDQIRTKLVEANRALVRAQADAAELFASTAGDVVRFALVVGLMAVGLVLIGAFLVRRWLITPIDKLQALLREFEAGQLDRRTDVQGGDELGRLGAGLNRMAVALDEANLKHRTLFANLEEAFVICDADGHILEYHDGRTHVLGVNGTEHIGASALDVWPEWREAVPDWSNVLRRTIEHGRRMHVHDVRLPATAASRTDRFVDFVVYPVESAEGRRHAAILVQDATERNRLQERLRHAETMEAIGTMAGGLAHDVNNLLTSLTASLSVLADQLGEPEQRARVEQAIRSSRRAASLSKRLLNFARGVQGAPQEFVAAEMVETIIEAMDVPGERGVAIERSLSSALRVRMDPDQFAQIVMNLITNACDAYDAGGVVYVSLREAPADDDRCPRSRSTVLLEVRDEGCGMPPEVAQRALEPFFTTKARAGGHGRGLGLATVYSAAKQAGGAVEVESTPGEGTRVSVFLPAVGAASESESAGDTCGDESAPG